MWQDGRLYLSDKKENEDSTEVKFHGFDDYNFWQRWSVPIMTVFNPTHNKDVLLEEIHSGWGEGYDIGNGLITEGGMSTALSVAKHRMFESNFLHYQQVKESDSFPELLKLYQWFESTVQQIFYHYFISGDLYPDKYGHELEHMELGDIDVDIHESWVHITGDGGSHGTHTHPMAHFGFIYCIDKADCDSKNGAMIFDGDVETGFIGLGNFWQKNIFSVELDDGMGIMFPAMLRHGANPYFTVENNRVVIACNININSEKYGGI